MSFEEQSKQYLSSLVSQGVFLESDLVGINEDHQTGKALSSIIVNGEVSQKIIFLYKENGDLTWKYFNPVDTTYLNFNEGNPNWDFNEYEKRIVAPINLIMDDIGIKMYGWFQLNGLPIITKDSNVYLYCNTILPEHQTILDQLQGVITVENRP